MFEQVARQVAGGGKGHGAVGAGERSLTRVFPDMHLEGNGLCEGTAAHPAWEGPLPTVCAEVGLEVAGQGEGQRAVRAFVRHVCCVLHGVLAHVPGVQHHSLAVLTFEAAVCLLAEQMVLQEAAVGERLVAVHAPVRLNAGRASPACRRFGLRGDVRAALCARVRLLFDLDLPFLLLLFALLSLLWAWQGRRSSIVHGAFEVRRARH